MNRETETKGLISEEVKEVTEEIKSTTVLGVVTECAKLRVRSTPKIGDNVVCTINFASEVLVDLNKSTEDFYSITTETGIEGFCMKQYINIGE